MKRFFVFCIIFFAFSPLASAATFEISGWIPYWRADKGTTEALQHLNQLTEVNPFGYTVKKDGELVDTLKINEAPWPAFLVAARAAHVRIIPTITWGDSNAIQMVLSSKVLRDAQIKDIVALVNNNNFDGIDIDYEQKSSDTRPYFSLFLRDLYKAMGKKFVECDIEARTPLSSRFDTVPSDFNEAHYANDYVMINKYCDRVRIMSYDQSSIDRKLNQTTTAPYSPVADPRWVAKVVALTKQSIAKNKIELGVATYGYEYKITPLSSGYGYTFVSALNPGYAIGVANMFGIIPTRNVANELSFVYTPTSTPLTSDASHLLWWSDATAIADKVKIAHEQGLRGVAVFKFDGGADPNIWNILK